MKRLQRSSLRILFFSVIALLGIFAETSTVAATSANDPDADGLTTSQETALGTNPSLFDTDGDGMSDGDEARAGTDPRSASSVFRILGAPKRTANGWEISWSSVPGKSYQLQRLVGDVIPLANIQWIDIQPVTASAAASIAVDNNSAGVTRFYRVVLVDQVGDSQPPTLGFLKADPSPIRAEGIVTLTVEASDNIDVASVTFFDGTTPLGSASRGEGDLWRFFWPLEFAQNGLHMVSAKAADAVGNTTTSSNLTFTAAITNSQPKQVVGQVPIKGDSFVTNGAIVTVGGNVRLGNATLSSGSTLKINSSLITGNGTVSLPGMGPVYRGAFEVDTATGWLHATTTAQPMLFALPVSLPPIQLSSNLTIQATNLTANILNNALSGGGTVLLKVDGDGGTVQFDGSFALDYKAFVLTVDGKCTYKGITAGGQTVLNVGKKTFQLEHGAVSLAGGTGPIFNITDGEFGLAIPGSSQAEFTIGGKLSLPIPLTITVAGKLSTQGSFTLTGIGSGTVAGFVFDPLELSLARSTTDAPVSLTFKGGIKHAVGTIKVTGTLNSDGTVTNLSSGVEDLNLGNGVQLLVENGQPVLKYLQEIAGVRKFQVNGGFRVPSPSPVLTSVHVSGTLELEGTVSDLHVKSFSASSEAGLNLTLPGNIIAKEAHVSLGYGNGAFNARLGGKIDLSDNAKIPFDAGLILQENDTQDIQIDALISPSGLNLNTAYLFSSAIRLEAKTPTSTRNASGKITIQGNVGFFRRGLLLANPTVADFYISGTNVTASFGFQGENHTALLSSGTLNLPPGFSTRICSGAGGGPAVSITPATPIVLTYSGSLKSLSITGGFDFSNLGFTIPAGAGAAMELCTARLVFASDTQYLTNITGRLLIPQASGDFQLTSGSMDASGKFDFTSSGKFVLAQTSVTYSALHAQYDGTNFLISGSGSAVLPNGAIAEVSARLTNGSLSFVGTQNRLDFGGGVVLVPIEPAAQNPMLQFAESGSAFAGAIKGRLQLPNNQFVEMTGTINNNVLTLRSTARVHLGDGVWLSPVANGPVLDLVANTTGALSFNVQGLFQWPGKGGVTEQTVVSGDLHLTANAQGILVSSFHADSSAPNLVLSLAPNLTLRQAEINLGYENLAFRAHIAGIMDIATTTLNVDAQLILNTANENDVRIAADLAVQNLNIVDQLYWFPTALRLEAQTRVGDRPEFTRLRATGKAGLFAKNTPLSTSPADGDFYLLARDAAAVLDLTADAFGIRIEQGTVVLPAIFQPGLCASGGAGPTAAVSAANPVIATYKLSTHALAFSGAIGFQNLGVTLPDFPQV
ncbi:MAG: hypothetical protein JWM99_5124, partial [Verrucomicrobiales bacterium]|nr:hypothetical protein [Verrucomicrobiales bacterium]